MTTSARNLIISAVLIGAALYFGHLKDTTSAGLCLAIVGALWARSGRRVDHLALLLLPGLLCAPACKGQYDYHWPYEQTGPAVEWHVSRVKGEYSAQAALLMADGIEMKPLGAAPTVTASRAAIYSLSADGLIYTQDANALVLKLHAASSYRTSANCAGLAGPINGDTCYDSTIPAFRVYNAGWQTVFAGTSGVLPIASGGTNSSTALNNNRHMCSVAGAIVECSALTNGQLFIGSTGATPAAATPSGSNGISVTGGAGTLVLSQTFGTDGSHATIGNDARLPPAPSAAGKMLYDTGAAYATFGACAANTVPHGNGAGAPTCAAVSLTADVTNTLPVANGGTGATTANQYYVFAAPASGAGAPGFRALVAGDLPANSEVFNRHDAGSVAAIGIATAYLVSPGLNGSATEVTISLVTRTSTSRNLYCIAGTAPGGADTVVFTVRENASDQALTCTITGAGTTCNDTSHTFPSAAGDKISIKAVSSGVLAAGLLCSWEETN